MEAARWKGFLPEPALGIYTVCKSKAGASSESN